ncbi:AMP-binding protein, partial [Acinetobacter baumannii]
MPKTFLITGVSSGFGRALAEAAWSDGHTVVGTVRNENDKQKFEALTGCKVVEGYGLSEASPSVTCNPVDGPVKEGSIGQPLPGTIVSLRDLADPTREVALGEKGEICIRGPQVMKGY